MVLLILLPSLSQAQEAGSADYRLDFGVIANEAEYTQSESFQVQDHSVNIASVTTSANFQILPPYLPVCGNLVRETGEECDGTDFGGAGCATYGYAKGNLICELCRIKIDGCSEKISLGGGGGAIIAYCGDGKINRPEEKCDDGNRENNDGCSKTCQLENITEETETPEVAGTTEPETKTETETETRTETKPQTKTPTRPEIILHPSAGTEEIIQTNENLHPAPQTESAHQVVRTTDQTPLLSETLTPETTYTVKIYDSANEEVILQNENGETENLNFQTDENGLTVYEIPRQLDYGTYTFEFTNGVEKNYSTLEIIDTPYPEITVAKFNDRISPNDYAKEIKILKNENNYLEGSAEKNAEVFIYLKNIKQLVRLKADENGFFSYQVPTAETEILLWQVYADQVISKNLAYRLETPPTGKSCCCCYSSLLLLILVCIIYQKTKPKWPKK